MIRSQFELGALRPMPAILIEIPIPMLMAEKTRNPAFLQRSMARWTAPYGIPTIEQDFLEEAPMSWDALVKKTFRKKEEILPMQMAEVRRVSV